MHRLAALLVLSLSLSSQVAAQGTPSVEFMRRSTTAPEVSSPFRVHLRLSSASTSDVSVPVSFSGSADLGADFTMSTTTVLFPAGELLSSIQFDVLDDDSYEGTERIQLVLGTPVGAILGQQQTHTLRIDEDDPAPAVAANLGGPATIGEPAHTIDPNVFLVDVQVDLSAPAGIDLPLVITPTGAAAGLADTLFEVVGPAIVPAGLTSAVVVARITTLPDDEFEGPEPMDVQVALSAPHRSNACTAGTLWVRDAEQLGDRFCQTNVNSTGSAASIDAWNVSPYKPGETITLEASGLPTDGFGYFLVSPVMRPAYPVASWYLCIGNSLHRVLGNGQVPQSAGTDGRITIEFDRTVDAGPYFVQPGETLHFQAWYTDPSLATSNGTGALSVVMR